jgi:hypothetical protein
MALQIIAIDTTKITTITGQCPSRSTTMQKKLSTTTSTIYSGKTRKRKSF